jgi:hypothetical protein
MGLTGAIVGTMEQAIAALPRHRPRSEKGVSAFRAMILRHAHGEDHVGVHRSLLASSQSLGAERGTCAR